MNFWYLKMWILISTYFHMDFCVNFNVSSLWSRQKCVVLKEKWIAVEVSFVDFTWVMEKAYASSKGNYNNFPFVPKRTVIKMPFFPIKWMYSGFFYMIKLREFALKKWIKICLSCLSVVCMTGWSVARLIKCVHKLI